MELSYSGEIARHYLGTQIGKQSLAVFETDDKVENNCISVGSAGSKKKMKEAMARYLVNVGSRWKVDTLSSLP